MERFDKETRDEQGVKSNGGGGGVEVSKRKKKASGWRGRGAVCCSQ